MTVNGVALNGCVKNSPDVSSQEELISAVLDLQLASKIIKVAERAPSGAENVFPHYTRSGEYEYEYFPLDWWTSGFFPGSIWVLYERSLKRDVGFDQERILKNAQSWSHKLEDHKYNTTTHDLGFLIMPSYQREYDLLGSKHAGQVIIRAADSLMSRWSETAQSFKSWDVIRTDIYEFTNPESDVLVIIDNMMNLDLLYSASEITGNSAYAQRATLHAETTSKFHVRADFSTYHLVVFDAVTGKRRVGLTHQGYDHESTWSRGQAWALYGYVTVYKYTKESKFLDLAKKLADYFMSRTDNGIVYWDFDAPRPCSWDTSAAMVAASAMLEICLLTGDSDQYLASALKLLEAVIKGALARPNGDVILDRSCVANYRYNKSSRTDHGLVYADYYFLEAGNKLIDLGMAQ
jgi:uncharacterized protein YyaL (SSP411 family)